MKVVVNGDVQQLQDGATAGEIVGNYDVFVRGGYGIAKDTPLADGDEIVAVKKGEIPTEQNYEKMVFARNGVEVASKLKGACVAICGLGGLGSNIAAMLARLGVGKLVLVDFDIVDPTNLNRQNYFVADIGLKKTEATARILRQINPYIKLSLKNVFVTKQNFAQVIEDAMVVVEAFDNPESKAMLVESVLECKDKFVVASSGMAGFGSGNDIKLIKPFSRLYIAGDGTSEAREGECLMSPRVNICAGQQANMVLRLLLGETEC